MNFPFRYHLGEGSLEVKLGSWTVRRIRYADIEEVRNGYPVWNEHWNNFWPWRFVTLRRRTGIVRNFVINPGDREAFVEELRRRMSA